MRFMNEFDIHRAQRNFGEGNAHVTPNRARAAVVIARLADWANANSDGWAYWPKPARSAAKLMELLESDGTWAAQGALRSTDATDAELSAALRPVKAFLTRHGVDSGTRSEILGER